MIASSQINIASMTEGTASVIESRRAAASVESAREGAGEERTGNGAGRELVMSRDAQLRYQADEQLAFASAGRVTNAEGRQSLMAGAAVAERAADVVLSGQSALRVGHSALGSGSSEGIDTAGSARLQMSRYTFVSESESRQVAASGSLELADGQKVDFSLALSQRQERQYEFSESVRIEERPMTDPLVINFGSPSARLNDTLFEFDLDSDGEEDRLASLGSGSGYLVLDRNGNGHVDDGGELFGPASGSGFGELSRLDSDGNRWVDASDPVFEQLGVMVQGPDGNSELRSLKAVGVEALYTGSTSDQFTLTSAQGVPLGEIKATGLYLAENGEVRTMEELDLAKQDDEAPAETEVLASIDGEPATGMAGGGAPTENAGSERIENIRQALDKLNAIRERQEAFIEQSRNGEAVEGRTTLDAFLAFADRLRMDLLERQEKNQQALNAYREAGRVGGD